MKRILIFIALSILCVVFVACNTNANNTESAVNSVDVSNVSDDASSAETMSSVSVAPNASDDESETDNSTQNAESETESSETVSELNSVDESKEISTVEASEESSAISKKEESAQPKEESKAEPKPEVSEDPQYAELLKTHMTPDTVEIWPNNRYGYERSPVWVHLYDKTNESHKSKLTGKKLKIWAIDKDGNKVDYMYTNEEGDAFFVLFPGEYTFRYEGDSHYIDANSKATVKIEGKYDAPWIKFDYMWPYSTRIDLYPKSLEDFTVYVTDKDTGEPIEGVYFTNALYPTLSIPRTYEGYTDKNGKATLKTLYHYQNGSGRGGHSIWFVKDGYDTIWQQEGIYSDTTSVHIELKKTEYYDFTIKVVDYWTKEPIKGVSLDNFNHGTKTKIHNKVTGEDGIIRFTLASEDYPGSVLGKHITVRYFVDPNSTVYPTKDFTSLEEPFGFDINTDQLEYTIYLLYKNYTFNLTNDERIQAGHEDYFLELPLLPEETPEEVSEDVSEDVDVPEETPTE